MYQLNSAWRRSLSNRDSDQVSITDDSDDDFLDNASTVDDNGQHQSTSANSSGQIIPSQPESMDFEEVQSVMWRKVTWRHIFSIFLIVCLAY